MTQIYLVCLGGEKIQQQMSLDMLIMVCFMHKETCKCCKIVKKFQKMVMIVQIHHMNQFLLYTLKQSQHAKAARDHKQLTIYVVNIFTKHIYHSGM